MTFDSPQSVPIKSNKTKDEKVFKAWREDKSRKMQTKEQKFISIVLPFFYFYEKWGAH
jgi:hypothetical protein